MVGERRRTGTTTRSAPTAVASRSTCATTSSSGAWRRWGSPAARTRAAVLAGIASCVLLAIALYVSVDNMELITAASPMVNAVLVGIVPLTLLIGLGTALWMRGARPATYARIGHEEDTDVPADAAVSPAGAV